MDILSKIVAHKKQEVTARKAVVSKSMLEQGIYFERSTLSMKEFLLRPDKSGIIAEFKRQSPSKGIINGTATVEAVTTAYVQAGVSGLSVLTDEHFFGGHSNDLRAARKVNDCPILRKDFIIDEYQLLEAKSIGADVILLIAECLDKQQLKQLARTAKKLDLEVLVEVHTLAQLDKLNEHVDIVGVNNRNLKDFTVSIQNSIDLFPSIPAEFIKISESGINDPKSVIQLQEAGFQGFLIGECFMKTANPGLACTNFIEVIQPTKKSVEQNDSI